MRLKESELDNSIQKQIEDEESLTSELDMTREQYYKEKREAMETEDLSDEFLEDETEKPTHTMLLNNLVKEVEIFSDDEDFMTPTKKWKKVVGILVLLVLIGLIVFLVIYFNPFEKKKGKPVEEASNLESKKDYRYEIGESEILFYEGAAKVSTYSCVNQCSIYSLGSYQYLSKEDHVIALQDGEKIFLYNFVDDKVITDNFTRLENLYHKDKTVAFIATSSNGKVGIVNTRGEIIVPFEYDNFGYSFGGGEVSDYSYDRNIITASKDGKWGMITLDSEQKEKIPFLYEDIYLSDTNHVAVKEEGLWYLADLDGKKVLDNGYDMVIPLQSYVLVAKDEVFNILNYKGEKIVSKDIPTYIVGFRGRTVVEIPTFKVDIDGTIVNIYIMKSKTNDKEYATYKFNTVNGEVTEVIS